MEMEILHITISWVEILQFEPFPAEFALPAEDCDCFFSVKLGFGALANKSVESEKRQEDIY